MIIEVRDEGSFAAAGGKVETNATTTGKERALAYRLIQGLLKQAQEIAADTSSDYRDYVVINPKGQGG